MSSDLPGSWRDGLRNRTFGSLPRLPEVEELYSRAVREQRAALAKIRDHYGPGERDPVGRFAYDSSLCHDALRSAFGMSHPISHLTVYSDVHQAIELLKSDKNK